MDDQIVQFFQQHDLRKKEVFSYGMKRVSQYSFFVIYDPCGKLKQDIQPYFFFGEDTKNSTRQEKAMFCKW